MAKCTKLLHDAPRTRTRRPSEAHVASPSQGVLWVHRAGQSNDVLRSGLHCNTASERALRHPKTSPITELIVKTIYSVDLMSVLAAALVAVAFLAALQLFGRNSIRAKNVPPTVPYLLPWIGSAITLGMDPDAFFKRARWVGAGHT